MNKKDIHRIRVNLSFDPIIYEQFKGTDIDNISRFFEKCMKNRIEYYKNLKKIENDKKELEERNSLNIMNNIVASNNFITCPDGSKVFYNLVIKDNYEVAELIYEQKLNDVQWKTWQDFNYKFNRCYLDSLTSLLEQI